LNVNQKAKKRGKNSALAHQLPLVNVAGFFSYRFPIVAKSDMAVGRKNPKSKTNGVWQETRMTLRGGGFEIEIGLCRLGFWYESQGWVCLIVVS